ncbi:pyridoxamine 5'-phosphate oxidase family protein [Pseudonocardia sp. S2-4]|uniref:Pyridoxamine 5'-phosphate oxidase family protein n=1 Tax=Pseudonocardia humida TaxID=2800819 RepID=A0ABT1A3B5_9PSEU|nr:pyridoxamine 5'-phosphate oxidase family protein [Pseudonocardia humida]
MATAADLEALIGLPLPRVAQKQRPTLDAIDVDWIARSPFLVLATSDADGRCDASPKGDPPGGLARVLDERTIAVPERPGNKRVDGYRNVLSNPYVGIIFLVPGRDDTLRVNGRARLVRDAPYFDAMRVKGHRPVLALEVAVEEVFYHCAKAFMRSRLWRPESWDVEGLPSRAEIAGKLERPDVSREDLERYYGPEYAERLYRDAAMPQASATTA